MSLAGPPNDVERVVIGVAGAGLRLVEGATRLAVDLALLPARLVLRAVLPAAEPRVAEEPFESPPPVAAPRRDEPAEDTGPGPEVHVEAPWEGYDRMTAAQVLDRLRDADPALVAMVRLYEERHKARKAVLHRTAAKP